MSNSNSNISLYDNGIDNSEDLKRRTSEAVQVIASETKHLKDKQVKIDEVIKDLENDVIKNDNNTAATNFRSKPISASEKMEKIKAYVELSRISVDISKTAIKSAQDIQKIRLDATDKAKKLFPTEYDDSTLTMDDVKNIISNPNAYLDDIEALKKETAAKQKRIAEGTDTNEDD